jgi:hypothetical protein
VYKGEGVRAGLLEAAKTALEKAAAVMKVVKRMVMVWRVTCT